MKLRFQTGKTEEDKTEKEDSNSEKEGSEEKEEKPSKKEDDSSSDDSSEEDEEEEDSEDNEEDEAREISEEDITKLALTDPSKLPPKLRGYAKKLQSIFTKRMQEASSYKKKSQLFDRLAADPNFLAWMKEQEEGGTSKSKSRSKEIEEDDDDEDDDAPITRKSLKKLLDAKMDGIEKKLTARDQAELERQERIRVRKFKKAYPDYRLYEDKILELIDENPRLSYVRAYKLAKEESEEAEDSGKSKSEKFRQKKNANSQKPNRMGALDSDDSAGNKKHKDGVMGAFQRAKNMLARGRK